MHLDPGTITIAGSEEILDTLNSYDLGTIDVADKTENFSQNYVVTLQNGVRNINEVSNIKVDVDFGDIRTKTIEFNSFTVENAAEKQNIEITDKTLKIVFRGLAADIEKLSASDVKVIVDLKNKAQSKGTNSVPVYVQIPDTYKIGVSGKYYVMIKVS